MKLDGKPLLAATITSSAIILILLLLLVARCSKPSQIASEPAPARPSGADAVTVAATAETAVEQWADDLFNTPARATNLRWLDNHVAVVTVASGDHIAEHVDITVVRRRDGWVAQLPPRPSAHIISEPAPTLTSVPAAATTDERWLTAVGFIKAWLTGSNTSRWTTTNYTPPQPSATYTDIEIIAGSTPVPAPNNPTIQVFAVEYIATRLINETIGEETVTQRTQPRAYRAWVAVQQDSTGRWSVTQLAHRPPPQ